MRSQAGPKLDPSGSKLGRSTCCGHVGSKRCTWPCWADRQNVQISKAGNRLLLARPAAPAPPAEAVPVWQICTVASTAKLPRLGTFGAAGFFFQNLCFHFLLWSLFFATLFLHFVLVVHLVFVFTTILQISSRSLQKIRSTPEARTPRVHDSSIRVHIAGVHLCNRFIATILGAPIFELQNHVHNPETAPTKCNGFTWLLATNKNAFCSSIIFEPFKDRNAFCSAPFGVQKYTKFITKNARHHFIALGRWLMEFLLPFQSRCAFQGWNCAEHFVDKGPRTSLIAIKKHLGLHGKWLQLAEFSHYKKHQSRKHGRTWGLTWVLDDLGISLQTVCYKNVTQIYDSQKKWGSLAIPVWRFLGDKKSTNPVPGRIVNT